MEARQLTIEEAINLLNDGERVHTFRNAGNMLIGYDVDKSDIVDRINQHSDTLELAGDMARSMKHALVLSDEVGYLFIEVNMDRLNEFDPIPALV